MINQWAEGCGSHSSHLITNISPKTHSNVPVSTVETQFGQFEIKLFPKTLREGSDKTVPPALLQMLPDLEGSSDRLTEDFDPLPSYFVNFLIARVSRLIASVKT